MVNSKKLNLNISIGELDKEEKRVIISDNTSFKGVV